MLHDTPAVRAFTMAGLLLAGAASLARATAAERDAAADQGTAPVWDIGLAVGWARRDSDVNHRLLAELERQGWGDDTADSYPFNIFLPGRAYAYSDDLPGELVRLWVARSIGSRASLRGEISLAPPVAVHGNRNVDGLLDFETEQYSLALMPMFGRVVKLGAGPALDLILVKDAFGVTSSRFTPALTICCTVHHVSLEPHGRGSERRLAPPRRARSRRSPADQWWAHFPTR